MSADNTQDKISELLKSNPELQKNFNEAYNETLTTGQGGSTFFESVTITNKNLSVINAGKSMQFDCPKCKHNLITKAWNYTHKFCPNCGVKIFWCLKE